MSNTLSSKALLAILNIRQWTGRRHDRRATDTVEIAHNSDRNVGNYTKKLLPSAKELEEIQKQAGYLRQFFYRETLPWYADGSRILSSKNYLDFTTAFRIRKAEFDNAVQEFLNAYPILKEQAKHKLGQLYQENEYPTASYLTAAFGCEISFMPIPDVDDFRVNLIDEEKQAFEKRMRETENKAMMECWQRLHGAVSHAVTRLQDTDSQVRESLIDNIKEICIVLPKLNFSDDPKLEQMRNEVEKVAASIDLGACRSSVITRTRAATELDQIIGKMSSFMGG